MSSSTVKAKKTLKRTNSHLDNGPDNTKKATVEPERSKSSDQGSATLMVSEEDFINLQKSLLCIERDVKESLTKLDQFYVAQGKVTKGKKSVKHPQIRKNPSPMAKKPEQTTPTGDQPKSNNHNTTQTAPPSDDSTVKSLLDKVIRKDAQETTLDEEKEILLRIYFLEMFRKLKYGPSMINKILNQVKLLAPLVEVGQDSYQPARILYLNLTRLDMYDSSLCQ